MPVLFLKICRSRRRGRAAFEFQLPPSGREVTPVEILKLRRKCRQRVAEAGSLADSHRSLKLYSQLMRHIDSNRFRTWAFCHGYRTTELPASIIKRFRTWAFCHGYRTQPERGNPSCSFGPGRFAMGTEHTRGYLRTVQRFGPGRFAMGTEPSSLIPDFALGSGTESLAMGAERSRSTSCKPAGNCLRHTPSPWETSWLRRGRIFRFRSRNQPRNPDRSPQPTREPSSSLFQKAYRCCRSPCEFLPKSST